MPIHKIFFVSNRARDAKDPLHLGSKRSREITYGYNIVNVDKNKLHMPEWLRFLSGIGGLFSKKSWKRRAPEVFSGTILSREDFLAGLKQAVLASGQSEIAVLGHGFNVKHQNAAQRGAALEMALEFYAQRKIPVVVFSWCANEDMDYFGQAASARFSVGFFQEMLLFLADNFQAGNMHLVFHSMASQIACSALSLMHAGNKLNGQKFQSINLVSADVDAEDFEVNYAPVIVASADRADVYGSDKDKPLMLSARLQGNVRRLGLFGRDNLPANISGLRFYCFSFFDDPFVGHEEIFPIIASVAEDVNQSTVAHYFCLQQLRAGDSPVYDALDKCS